MCLCAYVNVSECQCAPVKTEYEYIFDEDLYRDKSKKTFPKHNCLRFRHIYNLIGGNRFMLLQNNINPFWGFCDKASLSSSAYYKMNGQISLRHISRTHSKCYFASRFSHSWGNYNIELARLIWPVYLRKHNYFLSVCSRYRAWS